MKVACHIQALFNIPRVTKFSLFSYLKELHSGKSTAGPHLLMLILSLWEEESNVTVWLSHIRFGALFLNRLKIKGNILLDIIANVHIWFVLLNYMAGVLHSSS